MNPFGANTVLYRTAEHYASNSEPSLSPTFTTVENIGKQHHIG